MAAKRKQTRSTRSTPSSSKAKQTKKKPQSASRRSRLPAFAANLRSAHLAVRSIFTAAVSVPQFLESVTPLTRKQRLLLVDQALILLDHNYAHLPLKQAMHAVDPIQRLKLLRHRIDHESFASEAAFHQEMLRIFVSVRDLHTNYLLPAAYANRTAFLPFLVEEFFESRKRRYLVTNLFGNPVEATFVQGVEVLKWNGIPIERAVELNADRHAGSNFEARRARGIDTLTIRPLIADIPPDEEWVNVTYRTLSGDEKEVRLNWMIFELQDEANAMANNTLASASAGLDLQGDAIRQSTKLLYAPTIFAAEKRAIVSRSTRGAVRRRAVKGAGDISSTFPEIFTARSVTTPSGTFGYIRIRSFNVNDPNPFVQEFVRLAESLPAEGLIIDVRGNGGGHIFASEGLLQTLTPKRIQPELTQFINTELNEAICAQHPNDSTGINLGPWLGSIRESLETGAVYSRGFSITPEDFCNAIGQRYFGPTVLITDAKCYSATDIFAAGFQDHEIGPILGVDGNTGAGGANVWTHGLLRQLDTRPSTPYQALPSGANMRVAIRRSLRQGAMSGTPLEDLGVRPDHRHQMTRNDLLSGNVDLINAAASHLAGKPVRRLSARVVGTGTPVRLKVETLSIDHLVVLSDGVSVMSQPVSDGSSTLTLPNNVTISAQLALHGFKKNTFVAARRLPS
jgi:hypothetical protein